MSEMFLEKIGFLKHHVTAEEMDAANLKMRELTADYMIGNIALDTYKAELDKLPKIDFVQLAQDLKFKR